MTDGQPDRWTPHGVTARSQGDVILLTRGTGLERASAQLPWNWEESLPADRADAAAYVRGVLARLDEVDRQRTRPLAWVEAARTLLPRLERAAFLDGYAAAAGETLVSFPRWDGLVEVFQVERDLGLQLITTARATEWGASLDRIERAAASILLHRSRDVSWVADPTETTLDTFRIGDGLEATRVLVLEAIDWERCLDGCWVALPAPDLLLVSRSQDRAALERLQTAVDQAYANASEPLSAVILRVNGGQLVPCHPD